MDFSFDTADKPHDETSKIIENISRLEIGYIPENIVHREKQVQELRDQFFHPIYVNDVSRGALLIGPPGSGKTATAKWVKDRVESSNDKDEVEIAFVNCENRTSERDVYKSIMSQLGVSFDRGSANDKNLEKLLAEVNGDTEGSQPTHLVVILDELDALNKKSYINDVLYSLTDPAGVYDQDEFSANISVMAISNDQEVTKYFNSSVDSRFQRKEINFYPYDAEEIIDILSKRQEKAFSSDLLGKKALALLAKNVKRRFESDVRYGINVLKSIPNQLNQRQGVELTTENQCELVQDAVDEVQRSQIEQAIRENDDHFLLLLSALVQQLEDEEESKRKDINKAYRQACEYAALDKDGGGEKKQTKSSTYVYRRLKNDLVPRNILDEEKRYELDQNPYCYTSLVDLDLLREIVLDALERKGLADRILKTKNRQEATAQEQSDQLLNST